MPGPDDALAADVDGLKRAEYRRGFEAGFRAAFAALCRVLGDGDGSLIDLLLDGRLDDEGLLTPEEFAERTADAERWRRERDAVRPPAPEPVAPQEPMTFVRATDAAVASDVIAPESSPLLASVPGVAWEWASERDAALRDRWPTFTLLEEVDAALRALPGAAGHQHAIASHANALKLRRPKGFLLFVGKVGAARQWGKPSPEPPDAVPPLPVPEPEPPVVDPSDLSACAKRVALFRSRTWDWTPERDAAVRECYPDGVPVRDIEKKLRALPGAVGSRGAVAARATTLELTRGRHSAAVAVAAARLNGRAAPPLPPLPPEVMPPLATEQPLPAAGPDGTIRVQWSLMRKLVERECAAPFTGAADVAALNASRARRGEPPLALAP